MRVRDAITLAAVCAAVLTACGAPLPLPPNDIPQPTLTPDLDVTWRVAAPADVVAAVRATVDAEQGGVLCGGKVRLRVNASTMPLDSDPPTALRAVTDAAMEAAGDNRTWLLMTSADSAAMRVLLPQLGVAAENPIPIIGLGATASGLTGPGNGSEPDLYYPKGYPSFLRLTADDGARAEALARFISGAGLRTVAVIGDANRSEVMDAISARLKPLTVTLQTSFAPTATAAAIIRANPELVYFAGERGSEAGALVSTLRAAGYPGRFTGGPALLASGFADAAGVAAEGALTADTTTRLVTRAGDAAAAALGALKAVCADPGRDVFRRALLSPRYLTTSFGTLTVTASGDVRPMPVAVLVRAGTVWKAP